MLENPATGGDAVSSIEHDESIATPAVLVDRNELKIPDDVGFALAGAMQAWCATRDPRRLRRALLALLSALDDE